MKSILLSIRPEWVAKILNGEKTIEIRKKFPKNYVGWVYIYCTKSNNKLIEGKGKYEIFNFTNDMVMKDHNTGKELNINDFSGNGKVVAHFWCDKVEDVKSLIVNFGNDCLHTTKTMNMTELLKTSCLSLKELDSYLGDKNGYAIHISTLEVFDKPRELYEFLTPKSYSRYQKELNDAYESDEKMSERIANGDAFDDECANAVELTEMAKPYLGLTKAPQNYCYVEGEE